MTSLAALLSAIVAALAFRLRALTAGGAILAFMVGFLVLAGTGWPGGLALFAFFVTSTILSRKAERHQPDWVDAPGNRRNALQVAANGGVAALGGLLAMLGWTSLGAVIVISSLAAAAADTWATSLGMSARGDPMDIRRWKRVSKGTSGGVSLRGSAGGLAGAALVAATPLAAGASPALLPVALVAGIAGMFADSLLGATLQGRFYCPVCNLPSERKLHRCGTATRCEGGVAALTNDGVNFLATGVAGLLGAVWWALR